MKGATVAIIGGGFCGTLAAIRLLTAARRGGTSLPLGSRIVLIEPARPGQGLAYRRGPDLWRLNVPAERMSAFAERPDDFLRWARARDSEIAAGDFLPRAWYGDYLADRLALAQQRSPRWLQFEHILDRAMGLSVDEGIAKIQLSDGEILEADRVLLALGNSSNAGPVPGLGAGEVVGNAWNLSWIEKLPTYVPRVLLIGSGLTMIDIALAVADQRPDTRILAISRHGLLPQPQVESHSADPSAKFDAAALLADGPLHVRLRAFRSQLADGDWRTAIQCVREALPSLWQSAPRALRARFLRHLRAWWDVHRHRVPHTTLSRIEKLRQNKHLQIEAGRIVSTRRIKDGTVVTWRPRGSSKLREELVDAVVNVTGPNSDPRRATCSLVQSLLSQGLAKPDGLGLGWETDKEGRLLDCEGAASNVIYYAGPLLRACHWEATAVPELRVHVDRTAAAITSSLATSAGSYFRKLAAPVFQREQSVF
jgi:uncharacterized NAD(P)/FAD-binding protein YdhS